MAYGAPLTADEERPPLLVRAVAAWHPRGGWLVLALTWTAVITLPAAAISSGLIVGVWPAAVLATLGVLLAWGLAGGRLTGRAAAPLLALSGLAADLIIGVRVVRFGPLFGQLWQWLAWALGERAAPAPALSYFQDQAATLATFGRRVAWWVGGLLSGRGAPDNLVVIGLACLLAWALAAWAGWWVARRGQPFPALLPTAILLAQQVYWAEEVRWALLLFLGTFTMLLVMARLAWLMEAWEREGVDYSPEIRWDFLATGAALTCLVVVLAPTLPFLTSQELSQAFWRRFETPYRQLEENLGRSFAVTQPARSLIPAGGVAPGGLPRSHLLGGRPELSQEVALQVTVRGMPADQVPYWRGQTFAYYDGRGWGEAAGATQGLRLAAGEPWRPDAIAGAGRPLLNQVTVVRGSRAVLYAAGEPIAADRPYVAHVRRPGELIALSALDMPARYTVLSLAVQPDAATLRQAGELYPAAITSLYLQLPAELDPRLAALAAEWTAAAATPYDRAVALETALHSLPYTLDVPPPPPGREVVAWFLFDLRRGYCDYFATAMAVLARLSGIPARLAVGYAAGDYDAPSDTYVVTELNAHSWPELYFPGIGWVRFEPTPAQPTPPRVESVLAEGELAGERATGGSVDFEAGMAVLQASAAEQTAAHRRQAAAGWGLFVLNGLVLTGWVAGWWLDRRRPSFPLSTVPEVVAGFRRLARWGARLGRSLRPSDTPREYVAALVGVGERAAACVRWGRAGAAAAVAVLRREADALALDYERALFAAAEPAPGSGLSARRRGLWAALRRLWLAQRTSGAARK
ncbi:MAG: transglutaminase domain-containing protein [Anaerolineae bacterium]